MYHPNGNVKEFNVVMSKPKTIACTDQSKNIQQQSLSRNRLDSGYEEEDPLLSNGSFPERKQESVKHDMTNGSIDRETVQTMSQSSNTPVTQTPCKSELQSKAMQPSRKYEKLPRIDEKDLEEETSLKSNRKCQQINQQ